MHNFFLAVGACAPCGPMLHPSLYMACVSIFLLEVSKMIDVSTYYQVMIAKSLEYAIGLLLKMALCVY